MYTNDPSRAEFAEEARRLTERELLRIGADGPDFRWTDVRVIPHSTRSPGVRLAVIFHRDDDPGVVYGYWEFIWEHVAWEESYGPGQPGVPISPEKVAPDFVWYMDLHLGDPSAFTSASPPDEEGIRWIRAEIAWT